MTTLVRRGLAAAGPAAKHFRFLTMDHLLGQTGREGQADLEDCQTALKRVVAALARGKDKVALFPVDAEKTVWMLDLRTTARPDAWLAASADDPYLLRLHGVGDPDEDASVLRADAFITRLCAERALRDALGVMNADFQNDPTTRRVVAKYGAPLTASAAAAELYLRRSDLGPKAGALPLSLQDKIRPLIGGNGTLSRAAWTERRHGASLYQRLAEALEIGAPEIVSIHGD